MGIQLSSHIVVKILSDICVEKGIKRFVISAGSRNAPLIITFVRNNAFECYSITDERSAAFFALGMAERLGEPVGLICTSGTALLNYAPAVAEAYYKGIPLFVVSADRPLEKLGHGDGQMIKQEGALSNVSKYSCSLPKIDSEEDVWYAKCQVERVVKAMYEDKMGPVHVNVPLQEPLYETKEYETSFSFTEVFVPEKRIPSEHVNRLSHKFNGFEKILIIPAVIGVDEHLSNILSSLAKLPQVVVLTESVNNLHGKEFLNGIDKFMSSVESENEFFPDLVITLGDIIISRKIKKFIKSDFVKDHWHINASGDYIDLFQKITSLIETKPHYLLSEINAKPYVESHYREIWEKRKERIQDLHDSYIKKTLWSDLLVFSIIKEYLPIDWDLHLGNSTVVRYGQLFQEFSQVNCFCNRGTSGIDGCISTAVGSANVSESPTLMITGDLSFYYDSNALWNKYISNKLKIIVINNEGGGIFRFIDGPSEHDELTEFFENHQQRNVSLVAEAYGLEYNYCDKEEDLRQILPEFLESNSASILEIKTPREVNDKVLREYFKIFK